MGGRSARSRLNPPGGSAVPGGGAAAGGGATGSDAQTPQGQHEEPEQTPARTLTLADIPALQQAMGQTGFEAGDPNAAPRDKVYVKTSKSFNINAYLRTGSVHDKSQNSQWEYLGYSNADAARAVQQIDAGMRPLPENIALTRFVGGSALGAMLGNSRITSANIDRVIQSIATPQGAAKFAAALAAADYTEKGYTSTTYLQSHPAFDTRSIRLNIVARKGTQAIATSNHAENEILLGRNAHYRFTGGFRVKVTPSGVQQLEIDVEI